MGVEGPEMPGFIPAQDKQREITAVGIILDKALTLESHDASTEEHTAVDAWLASCHGWCVMDIQPLQGKALQALANPSPSIEAYEGAVRSSKTIVTILDWLRFIRNGP